MTHDKTFFLVCGVPSLLDIHVCSLYYSFPSFKNIFSPSIPYFNTCMCRFSWNLGASNSWKSRGLSRTVQGLPYRPCFRSYAYILSFLLILVRISLNSLPWPTTFLHTRSPNHHCMPFSSQIFTDWHQKIYGKTRVCRADDASSF